MHVYFLSTCFEVIKCHIGLLVWIKGGFRVQCAVSCSIWKSHFVTIAQDKMLMNLVTYLKHTARRCLEHNTSLVVDCFFNKGSTRKWIWANCSLVIRKYRWKFSPSSNSSATRWWYAPYWGLLWLIGWTQCLRRRLLFEVAKTAAASSTSSSSASSSSNSKRPK